MLAVVNNPDCPLNGIPELASLGGEGFSSSELSEAKEDEETTAPREEAPSTDQDAAQRSEPDGASAAEALAALASELESKTSVLTQAMDVSDQAACETLISTAREKFGRIDILTVYSSRQGDFRKHSRWLVNQVWYHS